VNDNSEEVKFKNVCILPVCMCAYCGTWLKNALVHTISNDFTDTTFFEVECRQASALLNAQVSLPFCLTDQLNMLQDSCCTGQNPQTIKKESETN